MFDAIRLTCAASVALAASAAAVAGGLPNCFAESKEPKFDAVTSPLGTVTLDAGSKFQWVGEEKNLQIQSYQVAYRIETNGERKLRTPDVSKVEQMVAFSCNLNEQPREKRRASVSFVGQPNAQGSGGTKVALLEEDQRNLRSEINRLVESSKARDFCASPSETCADVMKTDAQPAR